MAIQASITFVSESEVNSYSRDGRALDLWSRLYGYSSFSEYAAALFSEGKAIFADVKAVDPLYLTKSGILSTDLQEAVNEAGDLSLVNITSGFKISVRTFNADSHT